MPHLSPMNWIMSIIAFWMLLLAMSTSSWWMQANKFTTPKPMSHTSLSSSWKWSL